LLLIAAIAALRLPRNIFGGTDNRRALTTPE
jgi:hypothetical protein